MSLKNSPIRIAITTGDTDGIGLEVAAKALNEIGPQKNVQFVLWRSEQNESRYTDLIKARFKVVPAPDSMDVWNQPLDSGELLDVVSTARPDEWVIHAALACQTKLCDALVTGPLSKVGMQSKDRRHVGHTELLASLSKSKNLFMSFWGKNFSVILVTGHIPISQVAKTYTSSLLEKALAHAVKLRDSLFAEGKRRPIAVVGLNPHAGEAGLIGREEKQWVQKVIKAWSAHGVEGPLVPDVAFLPAMQDKYAVFVCPYHDQGLIPFKLVHGFESGVHVTLGLPFIRTSVDHGTAKEIFGLNQAQHGSMKDSILTAIALVRTETV